MRYLIAVALVMLVAPPVAAQDACLVLQTFGTVTPSSVSGRNTTESVVTWLRQFRTHDAAKAAANAMNVDLGPVLIIDFANDDEGWSRFRASLESFAQRDDAWQRRYDAVAVRVAAAHAAVVDRCTQQPGFKMWIEHRSVREFLLAARFDRDGGVERTRLDDVRLDTTRIICTGALTGQQRSRLTGRRSQTIDSTTRRDVCHRRSLDAVSIIVDAAHELAGGSRVLLPSLEPYVDGMRLDTIRVTVREYVPPHTRGDREFSGNGPRTAGEVWIEVDSTHRHLYVRLRIHMEEAGGDRTTASGVSPLTEMFRLYSAPDGYTIAGYPTSRDTVNATGHGRTPLSVEAGRAWSTWKVGAIAATKHGIADSWEVIGDTEGEDAGSGSRVRVNLSLLMVTLRKQSAPGRP